MRDLRLMIRRGALLSAVCLSIGLVGCGGSSGSPSDGGGGGSGGGSSTLGAHGCTGIEDSCASNGGTSTMSCEEHGGYDPASVSRFMSNCQHANQVYSTGPCDRTGAIGGCAIAVNGVCSVAWGYGPLLTVSDFQTSCTGAHGTFITP